MQLVAITKAGMLERRDTDRDQGLGAEYSLTSRQLPGFTLSYEFHDIVSREPRVLMGGGVGGM
jgi:hypothetical protein